MSQVFARKAIDEAGLVAIARALAQTAPPGMVVYLHGELGAGKTTFARAWLGAAGVDGRIKSPTYSLIESYPLGTTAAHHLDLYRLADPGELEWLGLADLVDGRSFMLVEWPERGGDAVPPADLHVCLDHAGEARDLRIVPASAAGATWVEAANLP
ncbi:MAG: tRNA (adenosine(37)-N6)-threonylcarbamoyltransferase complex ATPase subunit type 1 TsaE [Dokdonella sp.]|nr:tRNA (adenosine(37)-N6)-threonylcarbamoyltransferase complex ATPase subunit type 1 TsaE [Dokdonella sp.]MCW5567721.1 tRNA (adenosine(37)-N6)-threonylcarbamoyltransferase complex ATPase subunit type 1 TsaE [Dokdonella sp.]